MRSMSPPVLRLPIASDSLTSKLKAGKCQFCSWKSRSWKIEWAFGEKIWSPRLDYPILMNRKHTHHQKALFTLEALLVFIRIHAMLWFMHQNPEACDVFCRCKTTNAKTDEMKSRCKVTTGRSHRLILVGLSNRPKRTFKTLHEDNRRVGEPPKWILRPSI